MIDHRFSAGSFRTRGKGTAAAKLLAEELSREVVALLQETVADQMQAIVAQLNGLGHELKLYGQPVPGEGNFRDDRFDDSGYHCNLRLSADIVVSAGYAHIFEYDIHPDNESV